MATTKWQCSKCGKQQTQTNTPGQSSCPEGSYHVWGKLGRMFLKIYQSIF